MFRGILIKVFVWVPGHIISVSDNLVAGSAFEDAYDGDFTNEFILFPDPKRLSNISLNLGNMSVINIPQTNHTRLLQTNNECLTKSCHSNRMAETALLGVQTVTHQTVAYWTVAQWTVAHQLFVYFLSTNVNACPS